MRRGIDIADLAGRLPCGPSAFVHILNSPPGTAAPSTSTAMRRFDLPAQMPDRQEQLTQFRAAAKLLYQRGQYAQAIEFGTCPSS